MSLRRPHCHYPKTSFYYEAMKVAAAIVTMRGVAWVSVLNEGGQIDVTAIALPVAIALRALSSDVLEGIGGGALVARKAISTFCLLRDLDLLAFHQ